MGLTSSDLDRLIASALADSLSDSETAGLAVALAASGEVLRAEARPLTQPRTRLEASRCPRRRFALPTHLEPPPTP